MIGECTTNCRMYPPHVTKYMCEWPIHGDGALCAAQLCELHVRRVEVAQIGPVWLCARHANELQCAPKAAR